MNWAFKDGDPALFDKAMREAYGPGPENMRRLATALIDGPGVTPSCPRCNGRGGWPCCDECPEDKCYLCPVCEGSGLAAEPTTGHDLP